MQLCMTVISIIICCTKNTFSVHRNVFLPTFGPNRSVPTAELICVKPPADLMSYLTLNQTAV